MSLLRIDPIPIEVRDWMFRCEVKECIRHDFLDSQEEITAENRTMLLEWLLEIINDPSFAYHPEVFHLAIRYIDKFCCTQQIKTSRYQLLGSACLVIAAKYAETVPSMKKGAPGLLSVMCDLADDMFSKKELESYEACILSHLQWKLNLVTPAVFFEAFLVLLPLTDQYLLHSIWLKGMWMMNNAMMDYTFAKELPSVLAISALKTTVQMIAPDMSAICDNIIKDEINRVQKFSTISNGAIDTIIKYYIEISLQAEETLDVNVTSANSHAGDENINIFDDPSPKSTHSKSKVFRMDTPGETPNPSPVFTSDGNDSESEYGSGSDF
ncbi:cyclin-like protein [Paraphysoderma sedebokerense]|nr:cyclin-like protein [Paraphysoderma sedebokerense]